MAIQGLHSGSCRADACSMYEAGIRSTADIAALHKEDLEEECNLFSHEALLVHREALKQGKPQSSACRNKPTCFPLICLCCKVL